MKSLLRIEDRAAWSDDVSISGIDAYVASRTVSRRTRGSLKLGTVDLRSFLRYLKNSGWIKNDLSGDILVPKCYNLRIFRGSCAPSTSTRCWRPRAPITRQLAGETTRS